MIRLWKLGHVNLRVSDEEKSKWFYCDVLGLKIAERDPQHGGVFTTLGDNFHTLDIGQHPAPETAQRPQRGQIGLGHIAFQVVQVKKLFKICKGFIDIQISNFLHYNSGEARYCIVR